MLPGVDVVHGQPVPRDVQAGGFIEMYPEVITEVAVPIRYCDAVHHRDEPGTVWVSAPPLRDDRARACDAARMIAMGRSVPSPFGEDYVARSAFNSCLYARRPRSLASAGFGGAGLASASGIGLVLADSAAVLRPQDMYLAGTEETEKSLRALIEEWVQAGRPDHTALEPTLLPGAEGFGVEVHIHSG
jgi:protein-L-isoaspartate(D-aspartate) O-methyltransferase